MFIAKRAAKIVEQIQVGEKVLDIDLDPMRIALDFNKKYTGVLKLQQEIKRGKSVDVAEIGGAMVDLFRLIFGDENFKAILDFYDENYAEMLQQLMPFLNDVIVPKMQEGLVAIRDKAAIKSGMNRTQRRFLTGLK